MINRAKTIALGSLWIVGNAIKWAAIIATSPIWIITAALAVANEYKWSDITDPANGGEP